MRLGNLAGSPGRLWSKLVSERAARPKEFTLTVPSMPRGATCYALSERGAIEDATAFLFTRNPSPEDRYILLLRFACKDAAWVTDAPALAASLMTAVGLPEGASERASFFDGTLELVFPSLEYAR